jgi:hypothetical protein
MPNYLSLTVGFRRVLTVIKNKRRRIVVLDIVMSLRARKTQKGGVIPMDFMLAITRALLMFLEKDDDRMSALCARSFVTMNNLYYPEE